GEGAPGLVRHRRQLGAGQGDGAGHPRPSGLRAHHRPDQGGLAAAGLADQPEHPSGRQRERDAVHGPHGAARGGDVAAQVRHAQQGVTHRTSPAPGSTRSRRRSPTVLNDRTVRNMAAHGTSTSWGDRARKSLPAAIIAPQLGAGGGMPTPRKLSAPSTMIMSAAMTTAYEATGGTQPGSSSRKISRPCPAPRASAASTYSRLSRERAAALASRANGGTNSRPRLTTSVPAPGRTTAARASSRSSGGKARIASSSTPMTDSATPRRYAASTPSSPPTTAATSVAPRLTVSEMRAPCASRDST